MPPCVASALLTAFDEAGRLVMPRFAAYWYWTRQWLERQATR